MADGQGAHTSAPTNPLLFGALFGIAAAACFSIMSALIKQASTQVSTEMVVFFRSLFGMAMLTPWLAANGWQALRTGVARFHAARALTGVAAMYCFFYAIAHLNLGVAVLLTFTAPLFIPFIARWLLAEAVEPRIYLAIAIGFGGIALILNPDSGSISPAAYVGLLGGILAATAMVFIRRLSLSEPAPRVVFYFTLTGTVGGALPMVSHWQPPNGQAWLLLLGVAFFATAGQLLLTRGYSYAPAARIGLYTYISVVFAGLIGWLVWAEVPDLYDGLGVALVIGAAVTAQRSQSPASRYNARLSARPGP